MGNDYQTLEFKSAEAFRTWLDSNHSSAQGIWVRLFKKASGLPTVTQAEALDIVLCYGWIDGQRKSLDDVSFLQKYTPRRKTSLWSKRNIEYIERLTKAGLMMPAGHAEVDRAKADGRWQAAYDRPSDMAVPEDLLAELRKDPKMELHFNSLNKTNKYAIAWRLQTAKTETTRARRLEKILAMLRAGEKLY